MSALHRWTDAESPAEAASSLRAIARRHGVDLPEPTATDPILRAALIAAALIAVGVVALVTWLIVLGSSTN